MKLEVGKWYRVPWDPNAFQVKKFKTYDKITKRFLYDVLFQDGKQFTNWHAGVSGEVIADDLNKRDTVQEDLRNLLK